MKPTNGLTIADDPQRSQAAIRTDPSSFPAILSLATASPGGRYEQREIYETLARHWPSYRHPRVRQFFLESDIEYRGLSLDLAEFRGNESIDELHARFVTGAVAMGCEAIRSALTASGVKPEEIDFLAAATCTGYVCPGLTSLYAREFGFAQSLQRADLVGMGCAGALPAIQRAYDFVRSNPGKKALVVTVEVCSACYYLDDSPETIVGNAICADGAAAMVVGMADDTAGPDDHTGAVSAGGRRNEMDPAPRIAGFKTVHDTSFIDTVGFRQIEGRLRIVLAKELRDAAGGLVRRVVDGLLADHGLHQDDISHWILHPGGRKIIDAVQAELGLTDTQVRHSKSVLWNHGNMSSPTVLFVLDRTLNPPDFVGRPKPSDIGVMVAMGPGLAVESALLRW